MSWDGKMRKSGEAGEIETRRQEMGGQESEEKRGGGAEDRGAET
jgi:hypothetical protein